MSERAEPLPDQSSYWRITVDGHHDWTSNEGAANIAATNGYEVVGPYVLVESDEEQAR